MEGMTEELGGQSEKGPDDIIPVLSNDMLPIGKDSVSTPTDPGQDDTEPPPDWLKPLEDCEEEDDEKGDEVKRVKKRGPRAKRNVKAGRGRPSLLANKNNWEDCPDLGKGWKWKLIMWGDGKTAAYYMSPKGLRFRSKVQLARHLQRDLALFDYKKGKFMDELVVTKRKRRKAAMTEDGTRSSLPSSRTPTPDQAASRFPENVRKTPKNGPRNHRRPQLSPISLSTPTAPNSLNISPPQLSRLSSESLQHPSLSPSLRLNCLSAQTTSLPPLAPVSPPQTSENDPPTYLNGPKTHLSMLFPPHTPQLSLDPDGRMQHHGLPPMEGCANCGVEFPGMGKGKHLLCPKCRPSRKRSPHIIFRKVGKDKWVLGKSKKENLLKKFPSLRTKSPPFKSPRLNAQQEKEENKSLGTFKKESGDEDNDEKYYDGNVNNDIPEAFDNDEYGPRKRKRRMCGRCKACLREQDCRKCDFCLDKTKNGGPNKLRQKCRFRQCQVRSRLQIGAVYFTKRAALLEGDRDDQNYRKRSRSLARRKLKHRLWSRNVSLDEESINNKDDVWRPGRKGQRSRRKKWGRSLRRVKYENMIDPIFEEGGPGDLVQDSYVGYDHSSSFYESEELYSNSYIQNGTDTDVFGSHRHQPVLVESRQFPHSHNGTDAEVFGSRQHQPVMVESRQFPHSHELVYTVPGLTGETRMISSAMCNGAPIQPCNMPVHPAHIPLPVNPPPLQLSNMLGMHAPQQLNGIPGTHAHIHLSNMPGTPLQLNDMPGTPIPLHLSDMTGMHIPLHLSDLTGTRIPLHLSDLTGTRVPLHLSDLTGTRVPLHLSDLTGTRVPLHLSDLTGTRVPLHLSDLTGTRVPLHLSDLTGTHVPLHLSDMPGTPAPLHLRDMPGMPIPLQLNEMPGTPVPLHLTDMPGTSAPLQFSVIPDTPVPLQLSDVADKVPPLQINEVLTSNGAPLQLGDFLRSNGYDLVEVDTVDPSILPDAHQEPEPQHDPLPEPQTLDSSPEPITQIHGLTDSTEKVSGQNSGLLELLSSLRRTTLPSHWVGVMTRGPVLQLFQCSKLSPMADTVLQIESDFHFQVSVQTQPLLPTHSVYERHQGRLTSVSDVVAVLRDLEDFNVCQGYQSFEPNSQQEPLLCARAALCQLLVPQTEECCEKCLAVIV